MTLREFLSDRLGRLALQLICIGLAALFLFATGTQPGVLIILLFVLLATLAAVHAPSKRMRNMAVTETINEL